MKLSSFVLLMALPLVTSCGANRTTAEPGPQGGAGPADEPLCVVTKPGSAELVLRGTLLLPSGPLAQGELLIEGDHIVCAAASCRKSKGYDEATVVTCAQGVISPGLINPHDHISFADRAPLPTTSERYEHRSDWRKGMDGHEPVTTNPVSLGAGAPANVAVAAAELRFMIGGATSTASVGGISGLLRNLDWTRFEQGDLTEGVAVASEPLVLTDTFPFGDADSGELETADCTYPLTPTTLADYAAGVGYLPHVGEGINDAANAEFKCAATSFPSSVIGARTAIVHGVGLTAAEIAELADASALLVWSPRSNVSLYGNTASVTVFKTLGVPIALGSDWIPSGSVNLQRELACADSLNTSYFDHAFSDQELFDMVTKNAAAATGVTDELGALQAGYLADIAVFDGRAHADYRAVIEATGEDVALVLRGGVPQYGDADLLEALTKDSCDAVTVCGLPKRVCTDGTGASGAQIMKYGQKIFAMAFCRDQDAPTGEPTCEPARTDIASTSKTDETGDTYADRSKSDLDGDGIVQGDNCPTVFNPIRPLDGDTQADADADGVGDACDPTPLAAR